MYRGVIPYCSGDKVCIVAMSCVPVTSIEDSYRFVTNSCKRLEISNKAMFIINLL
jgi:hypothetical protein